MNLTPELGDLIAKRYDSRALARFASLIGAEMRQPLTINQAHNLRPETICQCIDALNLLAGLLGDCDNLPGEGNLRGMMARALAQVEADNARAAE